MNQVKTRNKLISIPVALFLVVQTIIGIFLPMEFSPEPPYLERQETNAAGENWHNTDWTKRKAITITENSGTTLTNYQIKITVPYDSDMQADFDDLRFTDEDGSTLIDYWLESKTDSATADFWVEIPNLTASQSKTVYMYYGNGSIASGSDGDATFLFFDGFESLDNSKWDVINGSPSYAGDIVTIEDVDWINGKSLFGVSHSVHTRGKMSATNVAQMLGWGEGATTHMFTPNGAILYPYTDGNIYSETEKDDLNSEINEGTYNTSWHTWEIRRIDSNSVDYLEDGSSYEVVNTNVPTTDLFIGLQGCGSGYAEYDWIFVRSYISPEPTVTSPISAIEEIQSPSPLTNWTYRKTITINASEVENTDQTDFPVLINLATDSDLASHAQNNGDDILFTLNSTAWNSGTENNKLAHEIEKYDNSTGELVAWVKIPTLSSSVDTTLYLYYGNSLATNQENIIAVWDENYKMVQHLQEFPNNDIAGHFDSTVNNNNGTPRNFDSTAVSTTDGIGQTDGADVFDGVDDYIVTSDSADVTDEVTIEIWINLPSGFVNETINIISNKRHQPNGYGLNMPWYGGGILCFSAGNGTDQEGICSNALLWDTSEWYHLAVSYNDHTVTFYRDGLNVGGGAMAWSGDIAPALYDVYIGASPTPQGFLYGIIDSVRISSIVRTPDYVRTSYNNQSSPSSFYTLSAENTAPNIPTLISPSTSSTLSDTTPTLSANYSDPDTNDMGTTNYRISNFSLNDCTNNTNIISSGTSNQTATNNETTEWTSAALTDQTYYWCAQNNDGAATSAWTEMGSFIISTSSNGSSGGGSFIFPTPPVIFIDPDQTFLITTINNQSTINLSNIKNAYQMAISTTKDFKYVSWQSYQEEIILPNTKIYLKFRSKTGGESKVYEIETQINNPDLFNGSLIRTINDLKVYIINKQYKRYLIGPIIFSFYQHLQPENIVDILLEEMNSYQESQLIRASNGYKIYRTEGKKKHWLDITEEEFEEKYSWDEVSTVNEEELEWYEEE